jgi:aminomethyltransferase
MQAGLVWSMLNSTELPPKLDGHTLRYSDPGDILEMLAGAVGPPTGVCVLEDTVVGAASWAQVPLSRQYDAVTNRAAAFVAGAMNYLRVIGPDAVSVLDLLTPKDMTKLKVGHGTFVLFTTPAGTIDNEAVVLRTAEDEFLLSCGGPTKSPSWLPEALEVHSRARVEQAGVACFNIKGPLRLAAMSRLVHPDDATKILDLGIFGACPARTPEGRPVWVLRTTIGVEMWGDGDALRQSWVRILDMPDLVTPCGWDLLDIFRVECEDMIFGVYPIELHGGTTLWEAGYSWMAGSPKPRNYIGRAALQETRLARRLWLAGLASPDSSVDVPYLGEEVFTSDGEFAGYVTTGAFSPKHQRPLAFAHLKPWCQPGQSLVVADDEWTVAKLPFAPPATAAAEVSASGLDDATASQRRTA